MNDQTVEQLARCAGATDEKGGRATDVFCFERHELKEFADSLIKATYKYVEKESKPEISKNIKNYWPAHCMLLIWNPDLMNFWPPGSNVRRYQRLNYRARGIVLHDRELNQ
jgi:hypothetical protein